MKKIIYLVLLLFCVAVGNSQPITARGTSAVTVSDARLQAQMNLFMPRYADTTAANLQKGIDSCGAIIFTYDGNKLWKRSCSPKRWEEISGGSGGVPSLQQVTDVGSTTTNTITVDKPFYTNQYGIFDNVNSWYIIKDSSTVANDNFYIQQSGLGGYFNFHWDGADSRKIELNLDSIVLQQAYDAGYESIHLLPQAHATGITGHRLYYPSIEYTAQETDTLATLADVRNSSGGGGTSYWSKSGNDVFLTTSSDAVGIGTSSPAYKLDISGSLRSTLNTRLSDDITQVSRTFIGRTPTSGSYTSAIPDLLTVNGSYGLGLSFIRPTDFANMQALSTPDQNTLKVGGGNQTFIDMYTNTNKIARFSNGNSYLIMNTTTPLGAGGGDINGIELSHPFTSTGANTSAITLLNIKPTYDQSTFGTGAIRGIYYNPTITSLNTSAHYAWESTSGGIKFGGMTSSTDTTIYKPVGIDVNGNLSKISNWFGNGGAGYVPYTGATQDVDLGTNKISAQSVYVTGTNGNGHIHLKHQSADATATGQSTALFADSNGDLKWKNDGNYYTTLKTSGNSANAVYTFPSATTTLIGSADTSVFQRKNIAAYSFKANNTNAAANATDQYFRDPSMQSYTGTITWTGTTAPSGTSNFTYNWTRIGNLVTLNIQLNYQTSGSALTQVLMTLPTDCPTPKVPTGLGAANDFLYGGIGYFNSTLSTPGGVSRAGLRVNAAANGYEVIVITSSSTIRSVWTTIQYFVN